MLLFRRLTLEMFWIRIPVFIVSFLYLDQRLSPQGSDLPKPFPSSILAHSATVLSYNMALIITCATTRTMSYSARLVSGRTTYCTLCCRSHPPRHNDTTSDNELTHCSCLSIRLSCLTVILWYACCTKTLSNSCSYACSPQLSACVMSCLLINEHLIWFDLIWV